MLVSIRINGSISKPPLGGSSIFRALKRCIGYLTGLGKNHALGYLSNYVTRQEMSSWVVNLRFSCFKFSKMPKKTNTFSFLALQNPQPSIWSSCCQEHSPEHPSHSVQSPTTGGSCSPQPFLVVAYPPTRESVNLYHHRVKLKKTNAFCFLKHWILAWFAANSFNPMKVQTAGIRHAPFLLLVSRILERSPWQYIITGTTDQISPVGFSLDPFAIVCRSFSDNLSPSQVEGALQGLMGKLSPGGYVFVEAHDSYLNLLKQLHPKKLAC